VKVLSVMEIVNKTVLAIMNPVDPSVVNYSYKNPM
jgi:hypothetical protein